MLLYHLTCKLHFMSTMLFNQTSNYSGMKISLNGAIFNRFNHRKSSYYRAKEASFAGTFCLLVPIMFTFFCVAKEIFLDATDIYLNIMITSGLVFRLLALNWVSNLLSKKNGSLISWQIITFLMPSLSLLIIGHIGRKNPSIFETAPSATIVRNAEVVDYIIEMEELPLKKAI